MNRSEARWLPPLLGAMLRELRRASNTSAAPPGPGPGADGSLYILLITIFCGRLAGALILAYTRSGKLESKHDPYHLYIERDWGPGGPAQAAEEGGSARERGGSGGRRSAAGGVRPAAAALLPPSHLGTADSERLRWMRNCSVLVQWLVQRLVQRSRLVTRRELFFNSLDPFVPLFYDKYLHYILRPFSTYSRDYKKEGE